MHKPLPMATPEMARAVWESQEAPSARSVARALTQSGRPVHFTTINRWRTRSWRPVMHQHSLDRARRALATVVPLFTGNPIATALASSERSKLEKMSDRELMMAAVRELALSHIYFVATCKPTQVIWFLPGRRTLPLWSR